VDRSKAVTDGKSPTPDEVSSQFGIPLDSAIARRERFADRYDFDFGQDRIFPELIEALLDELPEGCDVLEVGAATGLLTRPLLRKAKHLTALEPSAGLLRRLLETEVCDEARLSTIQGMVEDLPKGVQFDHAVVTFTPRRGLGLLSLLSELAAHVRGLVIMLLDEDGTFDWAYLARAVCMHGFDVRLHLVAQDCGIRAQAEEDRRAVILVVDVSAWCEEVEPEDLWDFEARAVEVPYPPPRGAATRLVRYFLTGGDRALLVRTDKRGMDRIYGNLRTAAHRLGKDEITVRRTDDGVQIVRLPKAVE
jgi:SAM-dependent methyltransferase